MEVSPPGLGSKAAENEEVQGREVSPGKPGGFHFPLGSELRQGRVSCIILRLEIN